MLACSRRWVVVVAAIGGCLGEPNIVQVGTTGSTGGGASTSSGSESEDTGEEGMELLVNGSFESWSGGKPVAWDYANAEFEQVDEDIEDGELAARLILINYQSLEQLVEGDVPEGACLDLEISTRWESDSTIAPEFGPVGIDAQGAEFPMELDVDWSADGEWHETQTQVVAQQAWTAFRFSVFPTTAMAQSFSVDAASARLVPCM